MREIKFRYIFKKEGFEPLIQILTLEEIESGKVESIPGWEIVAKNQFTGLRDKNGIEIWEGDIVKDAVLGISEIRFLNASFVVYSGAHFVIGLKRAINMEVIGNIYESKKV